jgi:hypothetical protein
MCLLADHALAVTCTDGLGLVDSDLDWKKCVGDAVARVAMELFVFKTILFPIQYCMPNWTNKTPRTPFLILLLSHVSFPTKSPQYTTNQPQRSSSLPLPLHILVGDLPNCFSTPRKETRPITACS